MSQTPLEDRPRERLLRHGPIPLTDADLIAIVLGTGARGGDALASAEALMGRFGDLRRLSSAGIAELSAVPGVGQVQACRLKAALALAGRLAERPFSRGDSIHAPRDVYERIGRRLVPLEREVFLALPLDSKNRVLGEQQIAAGGVCSVDLALRDVFTGLVREAATSVIFVHNHPSGDPSPSDADVRLTRRLEAAGSLLGIRVLDHVIVAQSGFHTFSGARA